MASNGQNWKSVRVNTSPATPQPTSSSGAPITPTRSPFTPAAALVVNSKGIPTTPATTVIPANNGGTPFSGPGGSTASSSSSISKKDAVLPRINVIQDPRLQPTPVRISNTIQNRDFSQPSHRFDQVNHGTNSQPMFPVVTHSQHQQTGMMMMSTGGGGHLPGQPTAVGMSKTNRIVDSRAEMKSNRSIGGNSVDSSHSVKSVPQYIGTSFSHLPNSKRVYVPNELPQHPTLPKPYPGLVQADFNNQDGLLSNRTADGKIVGSATKRFIPESHVPYYDHNEHMAASSNEDQLPVGPDNPYQAINDTWTKCWDKEAGAVYYYNNVSGEATWVMPDL